MVCSLVAFLCIFIKSEQQSLPVTPPVTTIAPSVTTIAPPSLLKFSGLQAARKEGRAGDVAVLEAQKRPGRRPFPPSARGPPPAPHPRFEPVDREKTCPLLLRVFTKVGGHHSKEDFAVRGKEPKDEVQIYTWKDATLRELTDLAEVAPAARRRDARLSFVFVYPDKNGRFVVRETPCETKLCQINNTLATTRLHYN
ncbi:histone deacetylase complex subunit SAP18-like [Hibiscus syriacus]|uniref:histone deacetylase complex subunit SAP18-like n=1 Tax=Hibiscus syriacus TaxID=106335 RepID=UPI0019205101|nr:histone deacetylase complex subunit SAP18-like [Hibiscus syriacus]